MKACAPIEDGGRRKKGGRREEGGGRREEGGGRPTELSALAVHSTGVTYRLAVEKRYRIQKALALCSLKIHGSVS
jgi:hypothetical protein